MRVLEPRQNEPAARTAAAWWEAVSAFHDRPAEVPAPRLAQRHCVDLFPRILSDVTEEKCGGDAIEAVPPRIAEPERIDLRTGGRTAGERVVRRDRAICVEAEELTEKVPRLLAAVRHADERTAVPDGDIEHPVRSELQRAAVMVGNFVFRLLDGEENPGGRRVGPEVARHDRVAVMVHVEDIELSIHGIGRMEDDAEQSSVVAAGDDVAEVEKRSAIHLHDEASLCGDVEPAALVRWDDLYGLVESGGNWTEGDLGGGCEREGQQEREGEESRHCPVETVLAGEAFITGLSRQAAYDPRPMGKESDSFFQSTPEGIPRTWEY